MIPLPAILAASLHFTAPTSPVAPPEPDPYIFKLSRIGEGVPHVDFQQIKFYSSPTDYAYASWYFHDGRYETVVTQNPDGTPLKSPAVSAFNAKRQFAGLGAKHAWVWSAGQVTWQALPAIPRYSPGQGTWHLPALGDDGTIFAVGSIFDRNVDHPYMLYTAKAGDTGDDNRDNFIPGGLSGPEFDHPVHKQHSGRVIGRLTDGTVVGYSFVHRGESKFAARADHNRYWRGGAGWLWKDGKYTPLPAELDANGDPMCMPITILPDDSIVVRTAKGFGRAVREQVTPITGLDDALEYRLSRPSKSGRSFILRASKPTDPNDRWVSDWVVTGTTARKLTPPENPESTIEKLVEEYKLTLLDDGTMIGLPRSQTPAIVIYRDGESRRIPFDLSLAGLTTASLTCLREEFEPGVIVGNATGEAPKDAGAPKSTPARRPRARQGDSQRSQSWILNTRTGDMTFIAPVANPAASDWSVRALALGPGGDILIDLENPGDEAPVSGTYLYHRDRPLRPVTFRCDLPLQPSGARPQIRNITHVRGGGVFEATIFGYGTRSSTRSITTDRFFLIPESPR